MQRRTNNKPPKKRTQNGQQNTQHRNSRSKRALHVQTSQENRAPSGNEQQSRMESSTRMRTGEQNKPQNKETNVAQTTQWRKSQNRQGKHERLPPTLHQNIQQPQNSLPRSPGICSKKGNLPRTRQPHHLGGIQQRCNWDEERQIPWRERSNCRSLQSHER